MRRPLHLLIALSFAAAARAEEVEPIHVEAWLHLAPVELPWPAFHDEDQEHAVELADLLAVATEGLATSWPAAGDAFHWPTTQRKWEQAHPADTLLAVGEAKDVPQVALAVAYANVDRFTKAKLTVRSPHLLRVFVDGEKVADKKKPDEAPQDGSESSVGEASADLDLVTGPHRILVAALFDPQGPDVWTISADLALEAGSDAVCTLDVTADHVFRLTDLLDVDTVSSVSLSADGKLLAIAMRNPAADADFGTSWIDIRDARTGEAVRSLKGVGTLGSFEWDRFRADRFAFVSRDGDKATLWVADMRGAEHRAVLEGVEHLGGFSWAKDSIVYSISEEPKEKHEGIKRYQGIPDRWTGFREKSTLFWVSASGGAPTRLTAGALSTSLNDVSGDGRRILFTRTTYTDDRWPFRRDELFELELATLEARSIYETHWGLSARYSPDGGKLLVLGSPTIFGDIGVNVPEGRIPNEYDGQAYLYDLKTGEATAFTRDYDPAVAEAVWLADGRIAMRVQAGSTSRIVLYDPQRSRFDTLQVPLDVVSDLEVAASGDRLAFYGTGLNTPQHVYTVAAKSGAQPKLMLAVEPERYSRLVTGTVKDFDFQAEDGSTISGRVYHPPGFDASRQYPAIVYYYGGTSPVERDFGGRYPKELWAAHGYVVYVMQPSGATGFGQEYSSRHVNNWGKTVAGEIIQGTRAFLAQHPFVDPGKVGCIGASYGGFMTMLLVTETDLFSAAVSHAGISSIASYWGEGWWGHLYSAAATAHSYPWNRPDVYVDQSPLFHADRIHTPLLLLHGGDDNNVPPGESEQMYSALRVLGKDVEYVRVAGERHWILTYDKRKIWTQTIMAWFDWKLKGQPQWWDHLYAEEKKE